MRHWRFHVLFRISLLAIAVCNHLNAQTTMSGALGGVVTDQTSAVVPAADVEIRNSAKGTTQSTKTDHEGVYRFFFLAPGRYTLTVAHAGFSEVTRTVDVLLGPSISVNVTLEVPQARS